jgi:hypothetical protein
MARKAEWRWSRLTGANGKAGTNDLEPDGYPRTAGDATVKTITHYGSKDNIDTFDLYFSGDGAMLPKPVIHS